MGHSAARAVGQKTRQKLNGEYAAAGGPAKGETRATGGGGCAQEAAGGGRRLGVKGAGQYQVGRVKRQRWRSG